MKAVDIHTHLSAPDFDADRKNVLERALNECEFVIDIGAGTSPDSSERALKLAEKHENVYFTAGIHPHDSAALGSDQTLRSRIEEILTHPKCVAVGECGLDYYYEHSDKASQKEVFEWQMGLAEKLNLPLMVHTRDAEADTKTYLAPYKGKAVFHCFTSSEDLAMYAVQRGFYISFSGIVTFKNAKDLQQTFLKIPLNHITIETDSPYLAPVPMRGKRNESAFVTHIAKFLADLRSIPVEELISATNKNAYQLFTKVKPSLV